jgi:hypothetical protein
MGDETAFIVLEPKNRGRWLVVSVKVGQGLCLFDEYFRGARR